MKTTYKILLCLAATIISASVVRAVGDTWTGAGDGVSWSDLTNWDSGVPVNTTSVIIADPIVAGIIGFDGGAAWTVASISVNSGTSAFAFVPLGAESLVVNGNFINNSINTVDVNLDYSVGANGTLDGPINFNSLLNITTKTATFAGVVNVGLTSLQLNNTTVTGYGRLSVGGGATLAFGGGANSVTFSPSSTYAGNNGDVFNLVTNSGGTVTGLNLALFDVSTLPALTGGLSWDTTNLGTGILAVTVPEPTTWALLAGSLTTVMVFRRRRSNV